MNWTLFRAELRTLLNDPVGGTYADADIDASATIAYHRVRAHHPAPISLSASATQGAESVSLPTDVLDITAVITPRGSLPAGNARDLDPSSSGSPLAYFHHGAVLLLSRPVKHLEAGTWTIHATQIPALPSNPTTAWDLPEPLTGAVLHYTAAALVTQRSVSTQRRGNRVDVSLQTLIDFHTRAATRITENYNRRARMT